MEQPTIETLAALFGDFVVYRNLEPVDPRLPGLRRLWPEAGLDEYRVPRKTEPAYARVLVRILCAAQQARFAERPNGAPPLSKILFIGDTLMNDGTCARNLGEMIPLRGFIGRDRLDESTHVTVDGPLYIANRWSALADFLDWAAAQGFVPGEGMALIVDIDKTVLGARGRNDHAIDKARITAVEDTVARTLGDEFDRETFRRVYDELNQPAHHPFTMDNQDYLAYVSLMVSGGVYDFSRLTKDLEQHRLRSFAQFMAACGERLADRPRPGLQQVHDEVMAYVNAGDPTPFKRFRFREFETTASALRATAPDLSPDVALAEHIVLTREVLDAARFLAERGALLFLYSDKPPESSLPREGQAEQHALHHIPAYVVGDALPISGAIVHKNVIRIPQTILDDMIAHAREGKPEEICGILSGHGNVVTRAYRAENVAEKPVVTYNFSPKDQYRIFKDIDEREEEMVAIYHSHPASPAFPSATDLRLAFYPEASYIILSLAWPEQPVVRAFRLKDGNIEEIAIEPFDSH